MRPMMTKLLRLLTVNATAICLSFFSSAIHGAETDPDGALFNPSDDQLADVRQALVRAGDKDRRALVVLGANWCHDSRALAARLFRQPLADVIDEHYELVLVDVGYYESGWDVTRQFGVANYYATPTVLIVDPTTSQLVNDEDRHIWGNAFNISESESVEYFERWATAETGEDSSRLASLNAEIDNFERAVADRVAAGYAVVGPMLAAYKAGNEPDEFRDRWDELFEFRVAITRDLQNLRAEARQRVAQGEEDIRLLFPAYPLRSWESHD